MENIYRATKLIGDAYAKFIADATPEVEVWLVHKLQHTFNVAQNIMDIFYGEKEIYKLFTPQERRLVKITGILHDLARFYQNIDGKHVSDKVFDHGVEAVKLLQDNPYLNDKKMLFAIYEHNKREINYDNPLYTSLPDDEKKKAELLAKLLRDADKLENIECFIYFDMVRLGTVPNGVLSEDIKTDLKNQSTVNYKSVKTNSDSAAITLGWSNDINFETTVKKLKELDFINKCINLMPNYGASEDDIKFLRENMCYHTKGC